MNFLDRKQQFLITVSISFAAVMATLDGNIVNISLPAISHYFKADTGSVARVTLIYLLFLTSSLLIFGRLGDKFGLKKFFTTGYIIFIAGSLFCGLAPTLNMLIASRALQALGASIMVSIGPALVPKHIPYKKRGEAIGFISLFAGLGLTLGAPLGGLITSYLSWQWIFLINIPIGIIATIVAYKVIPDDEKVSSEEDKEPFDYIGAVFVFLFILLILYALNNGKELGWISYTIIGSFSLAIILFITFIIREKTINYPLLDLSIFKNLNFSFSSLANLFAFTMLAGGNFLLPFYLIVIKKLQADQAGFIIMIFSVLYMIIGPQTGKLSDKIPPRILCTAGMISAMFATGFFAITLSRPGLVYIIIYTIWFGISLGFFVSPNTNCALSEAPKDKSGIGSAVFKMLTYLGMAMGVSIYETLFSQVLPKDMVLSQDTLKTASILPETLITGFQTAFMFGVFLALISAILSFFVKTKKCKSEHIEII